MKSREEGEDALETADGLVGYTGEEQSAGSETTSKDVSSQTDPRAYSLRGTCHGYSLSATVLALCESNAVRVFLLPVFKKQTAEQLCGCMPVPTQLHMYKLRQQVHHVSSAEREHCMLSWPSEVQSSILSQSLDCFLLFAGGVFNH